MECQGKNGRKKIFRKKNFEKSVFLLGLALLEGRHLAPPAETILPPPPYLKGKQGVLAFWENSEENSYDISFTSSR